MQHEAGVVYAIMYIRFSYIPSNQVDVLSKQLNIIMQTMLHSSPGSLFFCCQTSSLADGMINEAVWHGAQVYVR